MSQYVIFYVSGNNGTSFVKQVSLAKLDNNHLSGHIIYDDISLEGAMLEIKGLDGEGCASKSIE